MSIPDTQDWKFRSDITLVGSTITLNVNIADISYGNININLADVSFAGNININLADVSFAGNLNVNIASSDITLNINVTNEVLKTGGTKSCLLFNGENGYIVVPDSDDIRFGTSDFTIYVIFERTKKISIADYLMAKATYNKPDQWSIDVNRQNTGQLVFRYNDTNILNAGVINDGEKYQAAFIRSGDIGKIYLNNNLKAQDDTFFSGADFSSTEPLYIGCRTGPVYFLCGKIYAIYIYKRALNENELTELYNNPNSPPTNGLKAWWKFDEGNGDILHDNVGNNNGTIYNCIWGSEQGSVPASLNINIKAQTVGISIQAEWQAQIGNLKNLYGSIEPLSAGTGGYVINYSVPSGKTLYIYDIAVAEVPTDVDAPLVNVSFNLNIAGNSIARAMCSPESPTQKLDFKCPLKVEGGQTIYIYAFNCNGTNDIYVNATITGYEI